MKILVAEDNLVSSLVLSESLKKLGHDVMTAQNGREAWDLFTSQEISMVISDWMMPEMDGLELCRRIRSENRFRYTYFLLLTALSGKANYLEGMKAGADDFVVKPFDMEELAARLRVGERILNLQQEVKQLQGLLPICSYCKKIRDNRNEWTQLEEYVSKRTEALFSHSLCPECYNREMKPQLEKMEDSLR